MTAPPQRLLHDSLLAIGADPARAGQTVVIADGQPHSYAELHDAAQRLAAALLERDVARGDRVAIYMDNSWPCVVSIFAVLLAGGVFVLIHPQTKTDKLAFIVDDCAARVLVTDTHLTSVFLSLLERAEPSPTVISSGAPDADPRLAGHGIASFDQLIGDTAPLLAPTFVMPLDLAALIYTSGSTGQPKGVMQTHQSMVFTVGSLIEYLRLDRDARILCTLPLAFDYGLYQLLMTVALGATLVLERSFAFPAQVFARMTEQRVNVFPGVPTLFALLLSAHRRERLCFPAVACVTNTAAALPDSSVRELREIFPNALIYKMYGLTECKRVSYLAPELVDARPGSVGKAIPGTEAFVLAEDGRPSAPGEVGVLHVRGPHVMLGYWNRPGLSVLWLKPGVLPGERVLCTHDLFRTDADGFLYFVGRTDDIIKTRGEKVSPVEVENIMHVIPGIAEVAVVGVPDALLGQAIRACVVLEHDSTLSVGQIRAQCLARMENFMVPQQIELCARLPRTDTGKVSRMAVLEQIVAAGDHA